MSENGYIKIPRSLLKDPLWIDLSLESQHVFLVLLDHVCYRPRKFDDHGHLIDIEVGQICISERDLVKLCNKGMTRIKVQRSLVRLRLCRFLSQEVRHKKSIISITHTDTYSLIKNIFEPTNEPNLSQTRAKLEPETKKEKKDNKEKKREYARDSIEIELSSLFLNAIKKINSEFEIPDLQEWAQNFYELIFEDKRNPEDVKTYISWGLSESFWQHRLTTPEKLRKYWDTMSTQIKTDKKYFIRENKQLCHKICVEYVSKNYEIKLDKSEVFFIPLVGQAQPYSLKYSNINFKQEMKNELAKRQFKTNKVVNL